MFIVASLAGVIRSVRSDMCNLTIVNISLRWSEEILFVVLRL
jgi:hypothetical protein